MDVGYGQLDASLRNDPRVVVLERVNIRHLPPDAIPEPIDLATLDLSFISLTLVLPKILEFLRPRGRDRGPGETPVRSGQRPGGQGRGSTRPPVAAGGGASGWPPRPRPWALQVSPAFPSPLKGPKGNQEYFLYLIRQGEPPDAIDKPRD